MTSRVVIALALALALGCPGSLAFPGEWPRVEHIFEHKYFEEAIRTDDVMLSLGLIKEAALLHDFQGLVFLRTFELMYHSLWASKHEIYLEDIQKIVRVLKRAYQADPWGVLLSDTPEHCSTELYNRSIDQLEQEFEMVFHFKGMNGVQGMGEMT